MIEWYGIVVPAATPREVVQQLERRRAAAMSAPDVFERVTRSARRRRPAGAEEFAR